MTQEEKNTKARETYNNQLVNKRCSFCGEAFMGKSNQTLCNKHRHGRKTGAVNFMTEDEIKARKRKSYKKNYKPKRKCKACEICGDEFVGNRNETRCKKHKKCHIRMVENHLNGSGVVKQCAYCKKIVYIYKTLSDKFKFCDRTCMTNWRREKALRGTKNRRRNDGYKYRNWKNKVFKRDNYRCVFCGGKTDICAHHIVAWKDDEKLRYYLTNGLTVCHDCHLEIHGGNFKKPVNYEETKNKCKRQGIKLRKKVSDRIEELIRERQDRNGS
jgi:hypothetical protein